MLESTVIVSSPQTVEARLAELGLTLELLEDIRIAAAAAEASATPFEPTSAPGTKAWHAGSGTLRERKVLGGGRCRSVDIRNWPVLLDLERDIALTVATGDGMTGLVVGEKQPPTKNPRGVVVATAIARNMVQLTFPEAVVGAPPVARSKARTAPVTWFILLASTETELRAEVSLPARIRKKRIDYWHTRILLPSIPRHPQGTPIRKTPDTSGQEVVDVPVVRKR